MVRIFNFKKANTSLYHRKILSLNHGEKVPVYVQKGNLYLLFMISTIDNLNGPTAL